MKSETKDLHAHLFICTHTREDRASCGAKGSQELVSELKDWVKQENLKGTIKVTKSGCLGLCEQGIAAVCYPQRKWYSEVTKADAEMLKKELK